MDTNEILTLQALKFKQKLLDGQPDLPEGSPAWMLNVDPGADETRNICALISIPLFVEIERLTSVLSMSKRLFVELALRGMSEQANAAIDATGLKDVRSFSLGETPVDRA